MLYIRDYSCRTTCRGGSEREQRKTSEANCELYRTIQNIAYLYTLSAFADKKAELYAKGQPIDDFDILIGATAIYHKLVMITENVKHLNHLSSIKIENWIER